MINLIIEGTLIMKMSRAHLPWHTPAKNGPRRWEIVDEETGEVLDRYTPPRPKRYHPLKWAGSWAESMMK